MGLMGRSSFLLASLACWSSISASAFVDYVAPSSGILHLFRSSSAPKCSTASRGMTQRNDDAEHVNDGDSSNGLSRRQMLSSALSRSSVLCGAGCLCNPRAAYGLAAITSPPPESLAAYDLPRNALQDAAFAQGMSTGMVSYEREAFPTKKRLFQKLFDSLERVPEPVVAEIGIGSFPNALYYGKRFQQGGIDIIGVDPNDRMGGYAQDSAARAGLLANRNSDAPKNSLRTVHGVSEALPLETASCDAVVCTLTLCSVVDPAKSVAEMRRVLKPGGTLLFWEHVLSQTDPKLAAYQIEMTPGQVKRADGCHLDRQTGEVIRVAGFPALDLQYLELNGFGFLNPTVCGLATA